MFGRGIATRDDRSVNVSLIGKSYPPAVYALGREKIREYARAVGETNPLCFELAAAHAAGYPDLVAPPMFAAVYCSPAVALPLFDRELGIDFGRLVHGAQAFEWERPAIAGEELTTTASVKDISSRGLGLLFYVFETVTHDSAGEAVTRGTWTNIVRGE